MLASTKREIAEAAQQAWSFINLMVKYDRWDNNKGSDWQYADTLELAYDTEKSDADRDLSDMDDEDWEARPFGFSAHGEEYWGGSSETHYYDIPNVIYGMTRDELDAFAQSEAAKAKQEREAKAKREQEKRLSETLATHRATLKRLLKEHPDLVAEVQNGNTD